MYKKYNQKIRKFKNRKIITYCESFLFSTFIDDELVEEQLYYTTIEYNNYVISKTYEKKPSLFLLFVFYLKNRRRVIKGYE